MPRASRHVENVEFGTPRELAARLAERWAGGRFDLDVAASVALHVCPVYFTAANDGLAQAWAGRCYMNPPYGVVEGAWLAKAVREVMAGRAQRVVCLLPAKTGNLWWRQHVAEPGHCRNGQLSLRYPLRHLEFLPNKLRYLSPDGRALEKARFQSVVLVFEDWLRARPSAPAQ